MQTQDPYRPFWALVLIGGILALVAAPTATLPEFPRSLVTRIAEWEQTEWVLERNSQNTRRLQGAEAGAGPATSFLARIQQQSISLVQRPFQDTHGALLPSSRSFSPLQPKKYLLCANLF